MDRESINPLIESSNDNEGGMIGNNIESRTLKNNNSNDKTSRYIMIICFIISTIIFVDTYLLISKQFVNTQVNDVDLYIESNENEANIAVQISTQLNSYLHEFVAHGSSSKTLITPLSSSKTTTSSSSSCNLYSNHNDESLYLTQLDLISDFKLTRSQLFNDKTDKNTVNIGINKSNFAEIKDYLINSMQSPNDYLQFKVDCNMIITLYAFSIVPISIEIPISKQVTFDPSTFKFTAELDDVNAIKADSTELVHSKKVSSNINSNNHTAIREFNIPSISHTDVTMEVKSYLYVQTESSFRVHLPKLLIELGKKRDGSTDRSSALVLESAPVIIDANKLSVLNLHLYCDPSSTSDATSCSFLNPLSEVLSDIYSGQVHLDVLLNGDNFLYSALNQHHDIEIFTHDDLITKKSSSKSRALSISSNSSPSASCVATTFDDYKVSDACGSLTENFFGFYFYLDSFNSRVIDLFIEAIWDNDYYGTTINANSSFQLNNAYYFNGTFAFDEGERYMNHSIYVFTNDSSTLSSILNQQMSTAWDYNSNDDYDFQFVEGNSFFFTTTSDDNDYSYTNATFYLSSLSSEVSMILDAMNINFDSSDVLSSSFNLSSTVNLNISNVNNWSMDLDQFKFEFSSEDSSFENSINATALLVSKDGTEGVFSLASKDTDSYGEVFDFNSTVKFFPSYLNATAVNATGFNVTFTETISDVSGFFDGKAFSLSSLDWGIGISNSSVLDSGSDVFSPTMFIYFNCSTEYLGYIETMFMNDVDGTVEMRHGMDWDSRESEGYFRVFGKQYDGDDWRNSSFITLWKQPNLELSEYEYYFEVEDTSYSFKGNGTGQASGDSILEFYFSLDQSLFKQNKTDLFNPTVLVNVNCSSGYSGYTYTIFTNTVNEINLNMVQGTDWDWGSVKGYFYAFSNQYINDDSTNKTLSTYWKQSDSDSSLYGYSFEVEDTGSSFYGEGSGGASLDNILQVIFFLNSSFTTAAGHDSFTAQIRTDIEDDNKDGTVYMKLENVDEVTSQGYFLSEHMLGWRSSNDMLTGQARLTGDLTVGTSELYNISSSLAYSWLDPSSKYMSNYQFEVLIQETQYDFYIDGRGSVGYNNATYFQLALSNCTVHVDNSDLDPKGTLDVEMSSDIMSGSISTSTSESTTKYEGEVDLAWRVSEDTGAISANSNTIYEGNDIYNFAMSMDYSSVDPSELMSTGMNLVGGGDGQYYHYIISMSEEVYLFNMTGFGFFYEDYQESSSAWSLFFNESKVYLNNEDMGGPYVHVAVNASTVSVKGFNFFKQGWYQSVHSDQSYAVETFSYYDFSEPSSYGTLAHGAKMYLKLSDTLDDVLFDNTLDFSYSSDPNLNSAYIFFFKLDNLDATGVECFGDFCERTYFNFSTSADGVYAGSSALDWMFDVSDFQYRLGDETGHMYGHIYMNVTSDGEVGKFLTASSITIQDNTIYDGSNNIDWSYSENSESGVNQLIFDYRGQCSSSDVDIYDVDLTLGLAQVYLEPTPTQSPTFSSIYLEVKQVLENFPLSYQDYVQDENSYNMALIDTIVNSTNAHLSNGAITSENIQNLQVSPYTGQSSSSLPLLQSSISLSVSYYISTSNPSLSSSALSTALEQAVTSNQFQTDLISYSAAYGVPELGQATAQAPTITNLSPTYQPTFLPTILPTYQPSQVLIQAKKFPPGAIGGIVVVIIFVAVALFVYYKYYYKKRSTVTVLNPRESVIDHRITIESKSDSATINPMNSANIQVTDGDSSSNSYGISNPLNKRDANAKFHPDNEF